MGTTVELPTAPGRTEAYTLGTSPAVPLKPSSPPQSRRVYAAAHVVADPLAESDPTRDVAVDWDATLAFRRHLWALGLGVADAMDTAQRGMGLTWPAVQQLVRFTLDEAVAVGGDVVCGVGTDQLDGNSHDLSRILDAYGEQLRFVEDLGGRAVIMASRALAAATDDPQDYLDVYAQLLAGAERSVILHWLGETFDPLLAGYWGHVDPARAGEVVAAICRDNQGAVDGVKVSLLEPDIEVAFRRQLPPDVRCYTGNDFDYPELIRGDDEGHSDALLGIFDPIAAVAAAALQALDTGDDGRFNELMAPTVPLARKLFAPPTFHYKTGVVFLAYLAGHQSHFHMLGGFQSARSTLHLAELVRLADRAGVLPDPELAAARARLVFGLAGVGASAPRADGYGGIGLRDA